MVSTNSENSQQLIGLARRRAFELYLRNGRKPDSAETQAERKAINPATSRPAALRQHPTRFYMWRSAGDDRVRHSHAARHGQVFAWSEPPAGGHPGSEPNCRCWAAPYYGDPSIPDALQPLSHHHQVSTDPTTQWASIETLTRSDGSMAQSVVVDRDGTVIRSRFAATLTQRDVLLPTGQVIRVDTDAGVQSVYLGENTQPLFQSAWIANGPRVVRARQHVAFLLGYDPALELGPSHDPLGSIRDPFAMTINPIPAGGLLGPADGLGLGIVGAAMLAIYLMQQEAPASQGLGEDDVPFVALRAWVAGADTGKVAILADAIAQERIRKFCTLLPDAQGWTDEAALALAARRPILSATGYGKALHQLVKAQFESRKALQPAIYADSYAEYSIDASGGEVRHGTSGSSRLDLIQFVPVERPRVICIIDVKTGGATVQSRQRDAYMRRMLRIYPEAVILMMQVKPSVHPF